MLVMLVAAAKFHFEEQTLVVGSRQAAKAGRPTRPTWQMVLPAVFCAEAGLSNKSSCQAPTLGVTKFPFANDMILGTLCCST
jgi:hypothetical protein